MSARKMIPKRQQRALGFSAILLGVLALIVPLWPEFAPNGESGACSSWPPASRSSTVSGAPAHPRAAPQHVLRDQLILASIQPEVRFVIISSDVVYPVGAMKDYETKFWLPFKGVKKPVYAITGNHDWYDALEAFAATFLEPEAARTAMQARIDADLKLSRTNERRIDALIQEAGRLRKEYRVPTGFQQGPFFQFQTEPNGSSSCREPWIYRLRTQEKNLDAMFW